MPSTTPYDWQAAGDFDPSLACILCGRTRGHSPRCSVKKYGLCEECKLRPAMPDHTRCEICEAA